MVSELASIDLIPLYIIRALGAARRQASQREDDNSELRSRVQVLFFKAVPALDKSTSATRRRFINSNASPKICGHGEFYEEQTQTLVRKKLRRY